MWQFQNTITNAWVCIEGFLEPPLRNLDPSLFQNIILGILAIFIPFAIVFLTDLLGSKNQRSEFEKMVLSEEVLGTKKVFWLAVIGIVVLAFFSRPERRQFANMFPYNIFAISANSVLRKYRPGWIAVVLLLCLPVPGQSETPQAGTASPVAIAQTGIVKFTAKMPANALEGRPDTDMVELSNGSRVRLGDIRRLKTATRKLREPKADRLPTALRAKPAGTGTPLKNAADLAAALKRPDNDTVVLPSGRRVTVGMIRLLQPQVEKRVGRSLAVDTKRPALSGPAVKVGANTDWKDILRRPDPTVLEAPDGTRITVGELKRALAAEGGRP